MKKRILAMLLACVMLALAVPAVMPLTAAAANLYTDTFDEATDVEFSMDTRTMPDPEDIPFLFVWYDASNKPLPKRTLLTDDCYAVYNPVLIEQGVFSADEDFYVILEKYREHLKLYGQMTFNGDWSMVCMRFDGTRVGQINELTRCFVTARGNIYGLYTDGKTAECWEQFWVLPTQVREDLMSQMFEKYVPSYVAPGADGKIFFSEIKYSYAQTVVPAFQTQHSELGSGGNTIDGVLYAMPSPKSSTAYLYTVPENVNGEAFLTIDHINYSKFAAYTNPTKFCVTYKEAGAPANQTVAIWPEGADFTSIATWADLYPDATAESLSAALANLKITLKPGDQLAVNVGRSGSTVAVNLKPTVHIDKECFIEFKDASGNRLTTASGKAGTPFPAAPYAAGEGGYLINGVAAAELPETITSDMVVEYVGDVVVTDAAVKSIGVAVSSSFAINVIVTPDAFAQKVGYLDEEGEEVWGEKLADGTFKLAIPNLAAKDMDELITFVTVQEFADGRTFDGAEEIEVVPTEVLEAYADSDATDAEKAVAAAALDYVAAAKAYFYGDALDAEIQARLAAQDAAIAALESNVKLADKNEYAITGATLVCRDQVSVKLRVAFSEINFIPEDALDYIVSVEINGSEYEYEGFEYEEGGEELTMVITACGVAAADFDATLKFTVKDGSFAVSETFSYSVNDYIARTFDANAEDADLVRAIYALGVAANNA